MSNFIEAEVETLHFDAITGNPEKIIIGANFSTVSPSTVKQIEDTRIFLETARTIVNSALNGNISQWLEDNDTMQHGVSAGVRTDNATKTVIVNDAGVVKTITVVDIYIPLSTVDNVATTLYCFGPNNVRLIGHLNGRNAEAIIMESDVAINLMTNVVGGTTRIIESESLATTAFSAEIYEGTGPIVAFTAEIYNTADTTFTAEIYESA